MASALGRRSAKGDSPRCSSIEDYTARFAFVVILLFMSHAQVVGKVEGTQSHDLFIAQHPCFGKVILKHTGSHDVAARELRVSLALSHLSVVHVLEAFDSYISMTPCPGTTGCVPRWPTPQFFHYFVQLLQVWLHVRLRGPFENCLICLICLICLLPCSFWLACGKQNSYTEI